MNNASTTDRQPLDAFDDALVGELRQVVLARSAAPVRRRGRRPALAVASIAAVAAATFGINTLGSSAAFAVERTSNGDIRISIHRLDDAAGLEKELASYGIDAAVDYQPTQAVGSPQDVDLSKVQVHQGGEPGAGHVFEGSAQVAPGGGSSDGGTSVQSEPGAAADSACGDPKTLPMTTDLRDDDYVITIPQDSVLTRSDSELKITTTGKIADSLAGLSIGYTVGGATCGFGSMSASAQ